MGIDAYQIETASHEEFKKTGLESRVTPVKIYGELDYYKYKVFRTIWGNNRETDVARKGDVFETPEEAEKEIQRRIKIDKRINGEDHDGK